MAGARSVDYGNRHGAGIQIQNGAAFPNLIGLHDHIADIFGVSVYPEALSYRNLTSKKMRKGRWTGLELPDHVPSS